jgi:hypothetical protein
MERRCLSDEVSRTETQAYCMLATSLAKGFGDEQAVPRFQERAREVKERGERELQGLSPEQRAGREKAELQRGMKSSVKRMAEACRKGMKQYCEAVAAYCEKEGHPPDVCPHPPSIPAAPNDVGPRG